MRLGFSMLAAGFLYIVLLSPTTARADGESGQSWREIRPLAFSKKLHTVLDKNPRHADYWQTKPQIPATYYYSLRCRASDDDRQKTARLKAGQFRPYFTYQWLDIGVPPPWDQNPLDNNSWDFYRHSLRWLAPVIDVWQSNHDPQAGTLAVATIRDWIKHNGQPPGASDYAWYDHSASSRLRLFCWFWEVWRKSDAYDPDFARLLLATIYQHALFMCDQEIYPANSNHGLEMDAALLAAAFTFPEFDAAKHWQALAEQRLVRYANANFCPQGFHLEQSPFYHWYVLNRFGRIGTFYQHNAHTIPPDLIAPMQRMAAVWPYLLKPDRVLPTMGDSPAIRRHVESMDFELVGGVDLVRNCIPKQPNPRNDNAQFLISFDAGYAIFTTHSPFQNQKPTTPPTYAIFKCNNFHSPHFHHDALSFILFGLGRDWLVDAGQLNYEEHTPARQYMRSARAHNIVRIDGQDFKFRPLTLVRWGRDTEADFVSVRHDLEQARHTRTFRFIPPRTIEITDQIESTDDHPHTCQQLFHAAHDLAHHINEQSATLTAHSGERCIITQSGAPGTWSVIKGRKDPLYQGWYSPNYNVLKENATLIYTSTTPQLRHQFQTKIELHPPETEK